MRGRLRVAVAFFILLSTSFMTDAANLLRKSVNMDGSKGDLTGRIYWMSSKKSFVLNRAFSMYAYRLSNAETQYIANFEWNLLS